MAIANCRNLSIFFQKENLRATYSESAKR